MVLQVTPQELKGLIGRKYKSNRHGMATIKWTGMAKKEDAEKAVLVMMDFLERLRVLKAGTLVETSVSSGVITLMKFRSRPSKTEYTAYFHIHNAKKSWQATWDARLLGSILFWAMQEGSVERMDGFFATGVTVSSMLFDDINPVWWDKSLVDTMAPPVFRVEPKMPEHLIRMPAIASFLS